MGSKRRRKPSDNERMMLRVYREVDERISGTLDHLQKSTGTKPSCKAGCHFCCRQQIPTLPFEAAAIAEFVRTNFSGKALADLRTRTREWFQWLRRDLPVLTGKGIDDATAFYSYGPYCPFLVAGRCSIYSVRPATCRTHYVSSDPNSCRPQETDPLALAEEPVVLYEIPLAVGPILQALRAAVESAGINLEESVLLLPQWFVLEMNWGELWNGDGESGA